METIAVDVGSKHVALCKWDGRSLRVERLPTGSPPEHWSDWIEPLQPAAPYQVLFRSTHSVYRDQTQDDVVRLAGRHGARWVRVIGDDPATDPAAAAARYEARRHRIGRFATAEIGARHASLAVEDARGGLLGFKCYAFESGLDDAMPGIVRALQALLGNTAKALRLDDVQDVPLICFGGAGPEVAARLAQDCRLKSVLIPDNAGIFATVGMLMTDIVLRFREQLTPPRFDLPELRRAFGRLMDLACTSITMEGYDLDDAVCERVAEMCAIGDAETVDIAGDNLADESQLLAKYREARAARTGTGDESASIEVRAIRVQATVETLKPELPIPKASSGNLEDAAIGTGQYDRKKLPANVEVKGPARVQERYTTIAIPSDWSARLSPVGGLRLLPTPLPAASPSVRR